MVSAFASKYFEILKTFSEPELKSFDSWLNSSWCNSNKNLITLLDKVKKYYPDFDNDKLTKERLFKQVLPKGKYSDRRMNNLLSEGYQAAEKFIIFQKLSQDHKLQKDLLSQEFQSRHLEDWFFRDIQKEIKRLEEKEVKNWEDHLDLLRLSRRMYHHPNQNPRMQPGGETIVKMGEQLDLVYLLEKAAIINEKITRMRVLKGENHDVEADLENWLSACDGIENTALLFYSIRFAYTEATMLEQYLILREAFTQRYEELNLKDRKIHLISLINDTTLLIRKAKFKYGEILPLYKLGLKTKLLFDKEILTYNTYTTMISVANYIEDFDFTEKVIENYTSNLSIEYQMDALIWAKAHTAYYKKEYNLALDFLLENETKSGYFQLITRTLTTQVYFDLYLQDSSYQDFLINYFDSFEKWLYREKFRSEFAKKGFTRFVQKCKALEKLYSAIDLDLDKVENFLKEEKNLQGLAWLKEKTAEILEKRSSKN